MTTAIEPVRTRGVGASHAGPRRTHADQAFAYLADDSAAFAVVASGVAQEPSGRDVASRAVETCTRIFRERTASMLDDLAEVWWRAEHGADDAAAGRRPRPFQSLPIAERAELRDRVRGLLRVRVPDALGDIAVLEAETQRLLEIPRRALERVNGDLIRAAERNRQLAGIGASAACVIFAAGRASIAHIGTCRVTRLRRRIADALTLEHTVRNDYAAAHPELSRAELDRLSETSRGAITRALGMSDKAEIETRDVALDPGDLFLVANEGIASTFDPGDIRSALLGKGVAAATDLVARGKHPEPNEAGASVAAVAVEILGPT